MQPTKHTTEMDDPFPNGSKFALAKTVLGLSMALYGQQQLMNEKGDTSVNILEIAFLLIKGTALMISGILILYSSSSAISTSYKRRLVLSFTGLLLLSIEIWCCVATFKLTKLTSPLYTFDPNKIYQPSNLLVTGTLENKMRYTLYPRILENEEMDAGAPYKNADTTKDSPPPPSNLIGSLSMAMHVEVGSLDEFEHERGLAHFVEHLCFDASEKFNTRYGLWQELDRLGVSANAFTTSRSTVYEHFDFNNQTIENVLNVAKEQLLYTVPTTANINIEKGAVVGECRMRNDTESILEDRETCSFYGNESAICERFPIGLITTISKFTKEDVSNFLNKWYHPERTHIVLTGDFRASEMKKMLNKVFGHSTRGDKGSTELIKKKSAGRLKPQNHQNYHKKSNNVFYDASKSKNIENATSSIQLYTDILNYDGVELRLKAADPVHGAYYNKKKTADRGLRNVQEMLFTYVYSHMVLESIHERYPEIDDKTMSDFDITSGLSDDFDRDSRYHFWRIKVGNGFGGMKGSGIIESKDNQWSIEFESSLIELKRLSLYGPDNGLLEKAMSDYKSRNIKRTDTFYTKETSEIIAEMYGDRSIHYVWMSPWEIEKEEHAMTHPSMSASHSSNIQAEATLLWDTIVRTFLNIDGVGTIDGRAQPSPRSVFTVSHDTSLIDPPTLKKLKKIIYHVHSLSTLDIKISSLEPVKSDSTLFEDQDEVNARVERRKRRYLDKTKLEKRKQMKKHTMKQLYTPRQIDSIIPSILPSLLLGSDTSSSNSLPTIKIADKKLTMRGNSNSKSGDLLSTTTTSSSSSSDSSETINENYLIDVNRLQLKKNMILKVLKESKETLDQAKETEKDGAILVEETTVVKRYKLLNGIGVNIVSVVSPEQQLLHDSSKSKTILPIGPKGSIQMEIVSVGGKATLTNNLLGACHMVNTDYSEGYGIQYTHTVKTDEHYEDDNDEFTISQVKEALEALTSGSSDGSSDTKKSGSAGKKGGSDMPPPKGNVTHAPGGPSDSPSLSCEDEFTILSMTFASPCKKSKICAPEMDSRFEGTSWSTSFVPDMIMARVHMRPKYTTRSIRNAYIDMLDNEAAKRRDLEPMNIAKSHSTNMLLHRHLKDQPNRESSSSDDKQINGGDRRLEHASSNELKVLDPTLVTQWIREQFSTDRIEINLVGDFGLNNNMTSILDDLNIVFGTISPNTSPNRIGYDPYNEKDTVHFQRDFNKQKGNEILKRRLETTNALDFTDEACYVKHMYSRRSYVTVLVPSFDALDVYGTSMNRLSSHLTKRLIWSAVRKENGLSYSIHTTDFHSILYPDFGYTSINVEVGPYNSKDKINDPMNVQFTILTIINALKSSRTYDTKLFDDSKEQLLNELKNEFSDVSSWMKLIRGMSLNVPLSMVSKSTSNIKTLTDIKQGDILSLIESTNQKKFMKWTAEFGPMSDELILTSVVETIDDHDKPAHSNVNSICNPIPF
jgi:hypothetical protein